MSTHVVTLGAGPPVVAIHGLLLGSVAQWYFTLGPALAARHRVVMYDLPGHGLSSTRPGGYGLATLAADLERLLAELDGPADVVDLVGHSWGALVALTFAQAHPARVRRLVVIDPPLPPGDAASIAGARVATAEGLLAMVPAPVRDAILGGGRRATRMLERLRVLVDDTTLLGDVAAEPDLDDAALRAVRTPTLIVVGETSACRPAAERLRATLPDSRLAVVPGGHFVPVEAPAELCRVIVEFLDG